MDPRLTIIISACDRVAAATGAPSLTREQLLTLLAAAGTEAEAHGALLELVEECTELAAERDRAAASVHQPRTPHTSEGMVAALEASIPRPRCASCGRPALKGLHVGTQPTCGAVPCNLDLQRYR